jgi:capsule polysaccharide export protein KpsE/RkpR
VSANAAQGGMFVMHVTSTNFEYAQKFAAVWAQEFVDFKKQQRQQLIGNTVAQNTQLLLQFEKKFEQAQSALDDFQKKNYPSGLVDAGDTAQRAYDQARAELATLTSELREAEESTAEQHAAATGMQRWFDLKFDVKRAENRLVASPEDAAAKADLALRRADVKAFLELTDEERLAKVASIRRKATSRAKQVRELGDEIFSMTSLRSEYQRLKEDEKRMQDQVAEIRSRATSLDRIWADYEQLDIIQSGGGDPHPIGPNRPYMVLTGLLSGGLIGLLLVGLRALFRKTSGPGGPGTPQGLASSGPVLVHG